MRPHFLRLVALIARRDYLRTVRRRGFVIGTLLLPASLILIFTISSALSFDAGSGEVTGPVIVVNESAVALAADPVLTPHVVLVPRTQADAQLADGTASEYFVVPQTWPGAPDVQVVVADEGGGGPLDALVRQQTAQAEVELLLRTSLLRDADVPDETLAQLLTPISFATVDTAGQPVTEAAVAAGFFLPYAFTLIFVLSIFVTSGYLLQSVTEEKENRVVEIVLSSVPALPLMAGKVLGLGAAGLTQVLVWLLTAIVALPLINQQFSIDVSLSPVTLVVAVVCFCLGYLTYGAIFAAIGALAPGAREAQQYSSFFGFFAVVPLIATPIFLNDPNSPIVWALALFPLTAPAAVLELLAVPDAPVQLIAASIFAQVIYVAVAIVIAGRVFRATLLLYGTRPSLRSIAGAMFGRS